MKVTVPNAGAGEGAGKGSPKKPLSAVLPCLVGITCSVQFGCRSTNIAVFQQEICRGTVSPATGPTHRVGVSDLDFTCVFKVLNKNVWVQTELNGGGEGNTEVEKEEEAVSTTQKAWRGV